MRSAHTSTGSPMDTHTSVYSTSAPLAALAGSSSKVRVAPGLGSDLLALGHEGSVRLVLLGCTGGEVQAHLGAAHHQAVAHVVAGIAEVNEVDALQVAKVLRMVRKSARIWVGWNSLVRPFHTGTPA